MLENVEIIDFLFSAEVSAFNSLIAIPALLEKLGLTGPRGRTGKQGRDGSHGIPGISLWKVKVNGTISSEMLIPPSIASRFSIECQTMLYLNIITISQLISYRTWLRQTSISHCSWGRPLKITLCCKRLSPAIRWMGSWRWKNDFKWSVGGNVDAGAYFKYNKS